MKETDLPFWIRISVITGEDTLSCLGKNVDTRGRNEGTEAHTIAVPTSATDQFMEPTLRSIKEIRLSSFEVRTDGEWILGTHRSDQDSAGDGAGIAVACWPHRH